MPVSFANRAALITGGAGNIAMATARRLIAGGARVALVDRDANGLAKSTAALGASAIAIVADVTQAGDVARYAREARERLGPIDIFFNNAGVEGRTAAIAEFDDDVFERVYAVNVRGVYLGLKHVSLAMRDGGAVIITSSIAGLRPTPNFAAYGMSKHAVISLMKTAAREFAPRKIRVNTVHPGFVDSEMLTRIARERGVNGDIAEQYTPHIPLGRMVKPDDIAAMVCFLASDDAQMLTGGQYLVDGGTMLM